MGKPLEFFIPIKPSPKGNSKRVAKHGDKTVLIGSDTALAKEQALVLWLQTIAPEKPMTGAVRLDVAFIFPIPRKWAKKKQREVSEKPILHTKKPDRDNLLKMIQDAMEKAGFFLNDSQICAGPVMKFYGAPAGYQIRIEEIEED